MESTSAEDETTKCDEATAEFCGSLVRLDCGTEGVYQGVVLKVDPTSAQITIEKPFRDGVSLGNQVIQIPGQLIIEVLVVRMPLSCSQTKQIKDVLVPMNTSKRAPNLSHKNFKSSPIAAQENSSISILRKSKPKQPLNSKAAPFVPSKFPNKPIASTQKSTPPTQVYKQTVGMRLKALGKPIPTVGGNVPLKKVVGVTGTKFVGGTTLTTTGEELKTGGNPANVVTGAMKPQDLEKALLADVDIKPIGQEYIEEETDTNGKFINYNCKLCDCKFSDKNAKDIHLKGRRHRLQYKQKVDPSLKVEMKQWGGKKQQQKHKFGGPGAYAMSYHPPPQQPRPFVPMQRGHEIMDDQHVVHKLQQIQLSMDEGPTGMPAVDCLNGYRSYTDCFGESCVGNQRNGNWVNNSAGGGNYNKEFRKKRYGLTHQNQAVQPQFCEVFKISCAGQAAFVSGASPARFHCQEDRPISGRHSTGSIPSRRRPSPADSVRSEPTKSLSPLNTSSISATPTRAPLNHQTFGEFKLFREQQQAIPMRLQVNHRRNIHGEYGPTGMPAVDCLNGYRSYTDRCGEFFMGDPLDPNMETDFDFAGNLALFDKAEFNRETENVFHGLDSAGDCSRNYRNDENVLQDSSRVISWTKNTTADDDDNQNNSTSSPID